VILAVVIDNNDSPNQRVRLEVANRKRNAIFVVVGGQHYRKRLLRRFIEWDHGRAAHAWQEDKKVKRA
jgi:hypothetical protein